MNSEQRSGSPGRRNGDKECGLLKELFRAEMDRIESRLNDHERYDNSRFKSIDEALKLRTMELDRRLEGMNQLRTRIQTGISVGAMVISAIALVVLILSKLFERIP